MNKQMPFNVDLMLVDTDKVKNLRPVTSTDVMSSTGQQIGPTEKLSEAQFEWSGENKLSSYFNPDGLFSIEIFGRVGEERRDTQFSYIDIKLFIFHPIIYRALGKIKSLYHDIMAGKAYAKWDDQEKDFVASDELEGDTGYLFFAKHWKEINFKQTGSPARKSRVDLINKFRDRAMTNKILVMPAGLRDVRVTSGSRLEFDPINDIYRRVIGVSRTVASSDSKVTSKANDYARFQLQSRFNEIYDHIEGMLRDKNGFIQSRWARRRVFDSSRNVIASMNTSKEYLGDPIAPKNTDTILGFLQLIASSRPVVVNKLRTGYLASIFDVEGSSTSGVLVDPKTWRRENVDIGSTAKDRWTTIDGLQKVINSYKDVSSRHRPVMVEGYYLALIYKGPDRTFRIFSDISELPEGFDRKYVEPISLVEFLFLSGYQSWNDSKVIITRYPVNGLGSSYPSNVYVKTTSVGEKRWELGPDWQVIDDDHVTNEFPTKTPNTFVDAQQVSPVRMKGLGADFDGDTCSAIPVFSEEGRAEIDKILHSRGAYVDPAGGLRTSITTDTIELVLRNMTGNYPTASN